eukprot:TRINITY_DN2722_c0_g1_i4.p1 TRINITY_DN2722_c0_g1~~TRINITY_DN2722_c0_g1_i4.p1  ORF type:complete len:474 (+),score=64.45 TRINITY_DN2722_c0_g1_i4:95-1516(+)
MSTPPPAEALLRLVTAARAGGAAAADLSEVGEFLARGGVFAPAALRRAGLLPRADAAAAPEGLRGRGEQIRGGAAARRVAQRKSGGALGMYNYRGHPRKISGTLPEPPVSYSSSPQHETFVSARGQVLCKGGSNALRAGFVAVPLPWPAAEVRSGLFHTVALRRGGGAVCSWGRSAPWLGHGGDGSVPAEVQGLPPGDPVILVEVGPSSVIVLTESGEAWGWGSNRSGQLALPLSTKEQPFPLRIAALSGRGLRRLACGGTIEPPDAYSFAVAETGAGDLLAWGVLPPKDGARDVQPPLPLQPRAGRLVFPLRCLAAGRAHAAAAADGAGRLWCLWKGQGALASAGLPVAERVVRASVGHAVPGRGESLIVALTAEGCLWECRDAHPCRSILAVHPEMPLGLLPCIGYGNDVPLIADVCGGKERLRLFGRIAVRLGVPSDPVRAILTGLMVRGEYITGPAHLPFGWHARAAFQ